MIADIHCHIARFTPEELEKIFSHDDCPNLIIGTAASVSEYDVLGFVANNRKFVKTAVGIHPWQADASRRELYDFLDMFPDILQKSCAVGEIGYDFHPSFGNLQDQKYFFREQLKIAAKFKKPVIIHCRNAFGELFGELENFKRDLPLIVFHGYSGGFKYIPDILKNRCMISFGSPLTYPISRRLRLMAGEIPMEYILTETDAPYGLKKDSSTKNFPFLVKNVVEVIAKVKNMNFEEASAILFNNAKLLVGTF